MSFPFYGKLWIATQKELSDAVLREKLLRQIEPTRCRNQAHRLVGNIFARYIVLCNNLSELYDQTLQAQKRKVVEKILVSSTHRLLELQKEMQKIEMSEFVYLDDALTELKLTTQNIEFLRPFYFPRKRDVEIQQMIDGVPKASYVIELTEAPKGLDKFRKVLTPEEIEAEHQRKLVESAANLIKIHEKAKQQRVKTLNMKLFPKQFPLELFDVSTVDYDFIHRPDQAPLHKIKRSNYSTVFHKQKVNIAKFTYYEAPKFRINNLGHKVLVERKMSEIIDDDHDNDDSDEHEEEAIAMKVEQEKQRKYELEIQFEKKRVAAAIVIQRSYRRHRLQKALNRRKLKRMELCGLAQKPDDREKPKQKEIEEKIRNNRRERKKEFDERLMIAIEDKKARILKMKSQFIMEDISDDIRQWFKEFYDGAKDFHSYPEEFEGGTIMVIRGETKTVEEFIIEKNKTDAEKAKEKEARKKLKKAKKAEKKKQAAQEKKDEIARKKLELKQGPTWDFADKKHDSKHFDELERVFDNYQNDWQFVDETSNRKETPIWDWVTIDAYADVHQELRLVVDNFMRIELELLRFALAVDTKSIYIRSKPKKPKKEKKKRKRKSSVDVTEGRSLDECFEELKSLNIIRKYPKRSLNDFIGEENFAANELRMANKNPEHHYGDVRNNLRAMLFGMGPLELPKVKSLCIAGPAKSGKKLLIEALCTDLDAVMFDLSPARVAAIPNMIEFLSLVMKTAKTLQPSVIFIDGAHKPFIKKIGEGEYSENPTKLGYFLVKSVVKKLTKDDAIMLMGTTNQPWNCNYVKLRQCFEKVVLLPPTLDYGTALMTWNKGLQLKRIYNFDVSSLAQATRTFALGDILDFVDHYIDLKRRMQLPQRPLKCAELLEGLISGPLAKKPLDEQTIELFKQFGTWIDVYFWERKTTMARVQIEIDKEQEAQRKKQEMLKKKKKAND